VLHGGVNLLDKVDELKARSMATKQEMEVRRRQQEEQQRRLQQLQSHQLDITQAYASLEVRGWLAMWLLKERLGVLEVTSALQCLEAFGQQVQSPVLTAVCTARRWGAPLDYDTPE